MKMISIPIQLNHELAESWIRKVGKAFVPDLSLRQLVKFDPEMEVTSKLISLFFLVLCSHLFFIFHSSFSVIHF